MESQTEGVILMTFLVAIGFFAIWGMLGFRRWYIRWSLALIALGGVWLATTFFGAFAGAFGPEPVHRYRQYFFAVLAQEVEQSPDFAAAIRRMQANVASPEFEAYRQSVLPSPMSDRWSWALFVLLAAAGIAEYKLRGRPCKLTVLLFWSAIMILVGNIAWHQAEHRFAGHHLELLGDSEELMLKEFFERAGHIILPPAERAAAIRTYFVRRANVCHSEPFGELAEALFGPLPAQAEGIAGPAATP